MKKIRRIGILIVEIDDAGTGDIVGDAIIGFYAYDDIDKKENERFIFKNIPVTYYQDPYWLQKYPENFTADLIRMGLTELNFNRETDEVRLCTGNIFDVIRKKFDDMDVLYKDCTIEGKLQDRVEGAYLEHLSIIGVDIDKYKITIESGKDRFMGLINWISDDFPRRKKFVKSGFPAWNKKWAKICSEKYQQRKGRNRRKRSYKSKNRNYKKQSKKKGNRSNYKRKVDHSYQKRF